MKLTAEQLIRRYTVHISTEYSANNAIGILRKLWPKKPNIGSGFAITRAKYGKGKPYYMIASVADLLLPVRSKSLIFTFSRIKDGKQKSVKLSLKSADAIGVLALVNHNAAVTPMPSIDLFDISQGSPKLLHPTIVLPVGATILMGAYELTGSGISLKYYAGKVAYSPEYRIEESYKITWDKPIPPIRGAPLAVVDGKTNTAQFFAISAPSATKDKFVSETPAVPLRYLLHAIQPNDSIISWSKHIAKEGEVRTRRVDLS
jgi:hypothetical protein